MDKIKSGWKTTEFWGALFVALFGAYTALPKDATLVEKVVGLGIAALAFLGYNIGRVLQKQTAHTADAVVAKAEAEARSPQ